MTTTVEQKAAILHRWLTHRQVRGLDGDVWDQISFNWPGMGRDEKREVLAAYIQRRDTMHPSSPKRLPKYVIKVELGPRLLSESFTDAAAARKFIDMVIDDEVIRWKNDTTLAVKGGILVLQCEELEELMELETSDIKLPEPLPRRVEAFLRGKWPIVEKAAPASAPATKAVSGVVTLKQLCEREKWDARDVRVAMRKAKWEKPKSGEWSWPTGTIEAKLKTLMKK